MANEYKDVIRVEDTESNLESSVLRNGQLGFATDSPYRLVYLDADGNSYHWRPDEANHEYDDIYVDNIYSKDETDTYFTYPKNKGIEFYGDNTKIMEMRNNGDTGSAFSIYDSKMFINGTEYPTETGAQGEVVYCGSDGQATWTDLSSAVIDDITAEDVSYTHDDYGSIENVKNALDQLLHTDIDVSGISLTPSEFEKGSTVTDLDVSWNVNHDGTSQSITSLGGQGGSIAVGLRAFSYSGQSITDDQTISVSVTDDYGSDSVSTTLYEKIYKYWGQSASSTPNETAIETALNGGSTFSRDISGSRDKSEFSQAGGGNYLYYAYPKSWGTVNIYVNGFLSIWNRTEVSVTNASSNTEDYYCYTSPNVLSGTVTLEFSS